MELTGTVTKILDLQTGESKNGTWQKQEFIIETKGEYPKSVCMNIWGDKVETVKGLNIGDEITASINIESREYNGRWYTDVKCWKISKVDTQMQEAIDGGHLPPAKERTESEQKEFDQDLPF